MTKFKSVLFAAAALGVAINGAAANAEAVRPSVSMPSVVTAKKLSTKRTTAPVGAEANVISTMSYLVAVAAFGAATVAAWQISRNGDNVTLDSPG